ncbi:MAG: hypothetical protein AB7U73_07220 [Pirellulales bacterium]
MKRATFVLIVLVGCLPGAGSSAWAQRVRNVPPAVAQRVSPGVASAFQRVKFEIVGGRITCWSDNLGGRMTFASRGLGREESMTIDFVNGVPEIDYVAANRMTRVRIHSEAGDALRIDRKPVGETKIATMEFNQPNTGDLELTVGSGAERTSVRGATLWHLLLAKPELCREHLVPLLENLRPGWGLSRMAEQIEDSLCAAAKEQRVPDRARVARLVAQLGDDRFALRQAADAALRESGAEVLPYLQSLDPLNLDAEQRFRVRRIIASLAGDSTSDRPDQVVNWLAADARIWLALLDRDDAARRQLAAGQLTRVLGRPVNFDPLAPAPLRARQQRALAEWLDKLATIEPPPLPPHSAR